MKAENLEHIKLERMNLQFIKQEIIGKSFIDQVKTCLNPTGQFAEEEPNLAAFCFLSQQIIFDYDPITKLESLLKFIQTEHLPTHMANKDYRPVWNTFRMLKLLTINI